MIPHSKDINVGFGNINAKAEGIEKRPAIREAFQRRRCLVLVDSFCGWKKTAMGKQRYAIALADRRLMALAGVWENWRSPTGEWVRSVAIITTTLNELCAELHNRMPVVLGPETWPRWLGEEPVDAHQLEALLAPYPSEEMICWPVSQRVGKGNRISPGHCIEARSGPRMAYAFTSEIAAVLASAGPESPAGDYVSRTVPHLASPCLTEIANLAVDAATFCKHTKVDLGNTSAGIVRNFSEL